MMGHHQSAEGPGQAGRRPAQPQNLLTNNPFDNNNMSRSQMGSFNLQNNLPLDSNLQIRSGANGLSLSLPNFERFQ